MEALLHASFQAAILAVVVLALETLAGRWLTPHARLALWALVPLRLIVVFPLADPLGAARPDWWTWQQADAAPQSVADGSVDPQQLDPSVDAFLTGGASASMQAANLRTTAETNAGLPDSDPAARDTANRQAPPQVRRISMASPSAAEPLDETDPEQAGIPWLFLAWLTGAALVIARSIRAELRLRALLRSIPSSQNQLLLAQVQACAAQLGMQRAIEVIEMEALPSPAAYGWRRARLLLPEGIDHQLDEEELRFVILHELAHLRHHDSLQNLVMTALGALHWFNPLVAYAHHRIREERELLRDREALAALPQVPARQCAATLVKLLPRQQLAHAPTSLSALVPHHRTTRRRISMIIQTWRPTRLQLIPGVAAVVLLAWASLTHAGAANSPQAIAAENGQAQTGADDPQQVRVTRQTEIPAWRSTVLQQLQTEVEWRAAIDMHDLTQLLDTMLPCHVRTDPYLLDYFETVCAMPVKMPAQRALELLSAVYPMGWQMEEGGIYLFPVEESDMPLDLRFYDVSPLIGGNDEIGHELVDVVHSLTQINNTWDRDNASIQYWNGQLLVKQSEDIHNRIERILNMLLSRQSAPLQAVPATHRAALEQRIELEDGSDARAIITKLLADAGIPLIVEPDLVEVDWELTIDGPLHSALARLSRDWGVTVVYQEGAMFVASRPPLRTACYDVADLCEPTEGMIADWLQDDEEATREEVIEQLRWSKADEVIELMYSLVHPAAWEEYEGTSVVVWDGMLLITQTEAQHRGIVEFLSTARRAVRR